MKRVHAKTGFSLVETLVAMMIFILSVGVLAESMANALTVISHMEISEGHDHDYAFIRDQVLTISDTQALGLGGDVQTPNGGQGHWDAETITTETPDLFQLTLNMTLAGTDGQTDKAQQTLFVERPQWSETDSSSSMLSDIHDGLGRVRTQQSWP